MGILRRTRRAVSATYPGTGCAPARALPPRGGSTRGNADGRSLRMEKAARAQAVSRKNSRRRGIAQGRGYGDPWRIARLEHDPDRGFSDQSVGFANLAI